MVQPLRPEQLQFGMSPQLAQAMQSYAGTAGAGVAALGAGVSQAILGYQQRRAQRQQEEQQRQKRALMLQAARGTPGAFEELQAVDPDAALKVQQGTIEREQLSIAQAEEEREQQEFAAQQEQKAKEEFGRIGNRVRVATGERKREILLSKMEGVDPEDLSRLGLPQAEEVEEMSIKDLNEFAEELQAYAMKPAKVAELEMEKESELERRRIEREKLAIQKGKLEKIVPALKDSTTGRKEFTALSKTFQAVKSNYDRIEVSVKDPSPAGDLSLVFAYMKMLDPASTVREGEQAQATNAAGVPDRIRAMYNKLMLGESLAESQRADFLDRGRKLFEKEMSNQIKLENQFRGLARKSDIDPENVVIDFIGEYRPAQGEKRTAARIRRAQMAGEQPVAPVGQLVTPAIPQGWSVRTR